jgi:hypothetical protein
MASTSLELASKPTNFTLLEGAVDELFETPAPGDDDEGVFSSPHPRINKPVQRNRPNAVLRVIAAPQSS